MNAAAQKPVISSHRGQQVVLGRRAVSPRVAGPRRLMAHRLLQSLPPPPPSVDWIKAASDQCGGDFGMMLNSTLGCCTIAAVGHAKQIWTANNGKIITPPDSAILAGYESVDGYNPNDPSTDQGGVETDVLAAWQSRGVADSQIDAWIPVSGMNLDHVRKAIQRFGLVYIGAGLPRTIQNQDEAGEWFVDLSGGQDAEAGSLGGHAVILAAYDQDSFTCITWGAAQKMSVDWMLSYVDELYAPLCSQLWCPGGKSPLGDAAADLKADLQAVA